MLAIGMVCFMAAFIAVCSKTVKPPQHIPQGGYYYSFYYFYFSIYLTKMKGNLLLKVTYNSKG